MYKLFFTLILLMLTACATSKGSISYTLSENISYSPDHSRNVGDLFLPQTPGPHPLVIVIHGGGWNGGDRADMNMINKSLSTQGFAVFSINYRLAPDFKHPAPIEDLEKSYKYILKNAEKHNLDSQRIALWGYSAGAHIASYFALKNVKRKKPYPLSAVVAGGTPFDFTWYPLSPYIKKYLGDYRDKLPDQYIEASPITHLSKKAPPFFLYHAIQDRLVEHAQSANFEFQAKQLGIEVERYDITYWGHMAAFIMSDDANQAGVDYLKKKLINN